MKAAARTCRLRDDFNMTCASRTVCGGANWPKMKRQHPVQISKLGRRLMDYLVRLGKPRSLIYLVERTNVLRIGRSTTFVVCAHAGAAEAVILADLEMLGAVYCADLFPDLFDECVADQSQVASQPGSVEGEPDPNAAAG